MEGKGPQYFNRNPARPRQGDMTRSFGLLGGINDLKLWCWHVSSSVWAGQVVLAFFCSKSAEGIPHDYPEIFFFGGETSNKDI